MSDQATDLVNFQDKTQQTLQRAREGHEDALPALRELLDRVPRLCDSVGANLAHNAEYFISQSLGGKKDLAFREGVLRKMRALREELAGPSPTPIEQLLVERIVACWLQVQEADVRYAQAGACNLKQAEFNIRRQDLANQRFLSAMKTLATVRKLAVPVLQVNIGANQVNVANADCSRDAVDAIQASL